MRVAIAILILCSPLAAFPIPKGANAGAGDLTGTTWRGPIQWTHGQPRLEQVLKFEADGRLTMLYTQYGGTPYVGTWKQDGTKLTFSLAESSWYEATLNGDELTGTARNNSGMTATHSAKREAAP